MTEQAKTPHETADAIRAKLLRIVELHHTQSLHADGDSDCYACCTLREAAHRLADLSALLRAREAEIQELKDTLARRDSLPLSERQPAASTDRGDL